MIYFWIRSQVLLLGIYFNLTKWEIVKPAIIVDSIFANTKIPTALQVISGVKDYEWHSSGGRIQCEYGI